DGGPGSQFCGVDSGWCGVLADFEKLICACLVLREVGKVSVVETRKDRHLSRRRIAGDGEAERQLDSVGRIRTALANHTFGEGSGGFDIGRIVQENQRLERSV